MSRKRGQRIESIKAKLAERRKLEAANLKRNTIPPGKLAQLNAIVLRRNGGTVPTDEGLWPTTTFFRRGKVWKVSAGPCFGCSLARTPHCPKQQGGDEASCIYAVRAGEM